MSNTLSIAWLHIVWSTKDRQPLVKKYFRGELNNFLKEYASEKKIHLDTINGMPEHIHVLLRIYPSQNISQIVKLLKGASSKWINENYYPSGKFRWQKGYGVFSVGRNQINGVRKYIYNQEKHHAGISYEDEIKEMRKGF